MEKIALGIREFINDLIKEKVWGAVTFNFEAGEIRAIHQDLVWKPKDLCEAYTEPDSEVRLTKKRLVIRPRYLSGSMS